MDSIIKTIIPNKDGKNASCPSLLGIFNLYNYLINLGTPIQLAT